MTISNLSLLDRVILSAHKRALESALGSSPHPEETTRDTSPLPAGTGSSDGPAQTRTPLKDDLSWVRIYLDEFERTGDPRDLKAAAGILGVAMNKV